MTSRATVSCERFDAHVSGDAERGAVLLLHGFPGGADTWDGWLERLHAVGLRTIAPAQRGYGAGARPRPVSAYRIEHLVDDAAGIVEQLHDGPVHVIGHDWGGVVAWHLAALRPDLVAGLVVLSTPHPRALASSLVRSAQALRLLYGVWFQVPALPEATTARERRSTAPVRAAAQWARALDRGPVRGRDAGTGPAAGRAGLVPGGRPITSAGIARRTGHRADHLRVGRSRSGARSSCRRAHVREGERPLPVRGARDRDALVARAAPR